MVSMAETMREIVRLVEDQRKNYKGLTQTEGLAFIADRLNNIVDRPTPGKHSILKDIPDLYRLPEEDDPLRVWLKVEPIVEAMTGQPNWRQPFPTSISSLATGKPWNPQGLVPLPEVAITWFNAMAHQYPVTFIVFRGREITGIRKKKSKVEFYPEHNPVKEIERALWYLWRFFFHDRGWERLKRCPQCFRWFVDDTRNKQKLRCSSHCTWQWWSRDRRKKEEHRKPNRKTRGKQRKEGQSWG